MCNKQFLRVIISFLFYVRYRSVKIIWAQGFRDSQKRYRLIANCQFYRLVATFQQVATRFSISSSCNKPVKISLMLKQLATSLLITSLDNHLATSLSWQLAKDLSSTSCHRLNTSWYRLVVTSCYKMSTELLQLVHFWPYYCALLDHNIYINIKIHLPVSIQHDGI